MDIDFQVLLLSFIFVVLGVAIAGFLEIQTKVDMSSGYTREVSRYNHPTVILLSCVLSLFFMYGGYCIYKFFQYVVTIL